MRRSTARASPPSRATPRSWLYRNSLTGAIPTELGRISNSYCYLTNTQNPYAFPADTNAVSYTHLTLPTKA